MLSAAETKTKSTLLLFTQLISLNAPSESVVFLGVPPMTHPTRYPTIKIPQLFKSQLKPQLAYLSPIRTDKVNC